MAMGSETTEWIGVADVAAEMNLSERAMWEVIRKSGVKMVNARSVRLARFRRGEWEAARDASMEPAPSRAPYVRPKSIAAAPRPVAAAGNGRAAERERLRKA